MNKKKNKMPSFTLTELLVVMVISIVVAGLAFSVLGLLQKNVSQIQTNLNGKTHLRLLEQQLAFDLHTFPNAYYLGEKDQLKFISPIDSVFYEFQEGYIARKLDTFFISSIEKEFYFEGKTLSTGTIDALKLMSLEKEKVNTIFLFKRNDVLSKMSYGN